MRPVGWAIAGFGWVARDFAVPAILQNGDRIVGICDPGERARAAAGNMGLPAHSSLDPLLGDDDVDAVYVATPNDRHRACVTRAAESGRAVLCEKPMAATLADAEAIAISVRDCGILYGTAFDQRHHPAHVLMHDLIQDGSIGTVTAIRIVYACWLGNSWNLAGEDGNWRVDGARAGGGALMDLAPHGIDLVEFLLGQRLQTVTALVQNRVQDYRVDDGAVLVGKTATDVLATLHVAYNHPETLPRRRLEVVGTRGMLVAENTMGQEAGGRLTRHDAATGATSDIAFAQTSPFRQQMAAFSRAVCGGEMTFDVERDLHTMRLITRAYQEAECR